VNLSYKDRLVVDTIPW